MQNSEPWQIYKLQDNWQKIYEERIEIIWRQFIQLNTQYFILDKLSTFRFDLFDGSKGPFWPAVYASLLESNILLLYKLIVDPDKRVLSILKFAKDIKKNLKPEYVAEFKNKWSSLDFDAKIEKIIDKVKELRNKAVAHLNKEYHTAILANSINEIKVGLDEHKELINASNKIFDFLCFGKGRSVFYVQYLLRIENSEKEEYLSDIEKILNKVAFHSKIWRMPEEQKEFWPHFREKNLSENDIKEINKYRTMFGFFEI